MICLGSDLEKDYMHLNKATHKPKQYKPHTVSDNKLHVSKPKATVTKVVMRQ